MPVSTRACACVRGCDVGSGEVTGGTVVVEVCAPGLPVDAHTLTYASDTRGSHFIQRVRGQVTSGHKADCRLPPYYQCLLNWSDAIWDERLHHEAELELRLLQWMCPLVCPCVSGFLLLFVFLALEQS